jgi:hypothetical protein
LLPFFFKDPRHLLPGPTKPIPSSAAQILQNSFALPALAYVYVANLLAHRVEEFMFVAFLWQVINFDRVRIWRKPPNQPVTDHPLIRIM